MTLAAHHAGNALPEHADQPNMTLQRLERSSLMGSAEVTARLLLGTLLVRDHPDGRRIARIVETEAYAGPEDRASHARAGRTQRTSVMFGPPGHAYVYLVYGLHHCFNVVCSEEGVAAAVLIRALEPVAGTTLMHRRRGIAAGADARLAAGPARTCQALDIDRTHDGIDLLGEGDLWLAHAQGSLPAVGRIVSGSRIGVDYAGPEWATRAWRFGVADSPALSRPFPDRA